MKKRRREKILRRHRHRRRRHGHSRYTVLCFGNYILDGVRFVGAALFSSFIVIDKYCAVTLVWKAFTEFMFIGCGCERTRCMHIQMKKSCRFFAININLSILGDTSHTKYGDALSSIFIGRRQFHFQFTISHLFKSIRSKSSTLGKSSRTNGRPNEKKRHKIKWIGLYAEINFKIINNTSFTNAQIV